MFASIVNKEKHPKMTDEFFEAENVVRYDLHRAPFLEHFHRNNPMLEFDNVLKMPKERPFNYETCKMKVWIANFGYPDHPYNLLLWCYCPKEKIFFYEKVWYANQRLMPLPWKAE